MIAEDDRLRGNMNSIRFDSIRFDSIMFERLNRAAYISKLSGVHVRLYCYRILTISSNDTLYASTGTGY